MSGKFGDMLKGGYYRDERILCLGMKERKGGNREEGLGEYY